MRILLACLLAAAAAPTSAQDAERGRVLYETFCMSCHYERVHERPSERSLVKSSTDLRTQVARWSERTRMRFTPQDVDDVAEYLNRSHYKMEK
jgi:mono/diheme cytochrome c family protein